MLRTATALLSVQGITWLTSLISVTVVPRYLGTAHYGLLAAAGTAMIIAALLAAFGTSTFLVKHTARYPDTARTVVAHVVVLRLLVWSILCALMLPPIIAFSDSYETRMVITLGAAAGAAALVQDALVSALQGMHKLGRVSIAIATLGITGQVALVAILVAGGGVVGATAIALAGAVVALAIVSVLFIMQTKGTPELSFSGLREILRTGPPYLAWDLGVRVFGTIDLVLLALLASTADVGEYAFAYRLATIPIFAATVVTMAVYPALSSAHLGDNQFFRRVLSQAVRAVSFLMLPMAAGIIVLSPLLTTTFGGEKFEGAWVLLIIVAAQMPLAGIHTVLGTALFASDRQKYMAQVAWRAVPLNVTLNLVLIPLSVRFGGHPAIACACITAVTEIFVGYYVWRGAWGYLNHGEALGGFARAFVATAIMATVVLLLRPLLPLAGLIAAGVITYGLAALGSGAASLADVRKVRDHFLLRQQPAAAPPETLDRIPG